MRGAIGAKWPGLGATLAVTLASCVLAPSAHAAGWLPTFDLGGTGLHRVNISPDGDMAFVLNTDTGLALRFRPVGGPLGPFENPFPAGATGVDSDMDAQGNTYLVWSNGGTLEERIRHRDGSLTDIRTLQAGVLPGSGRVTVSADGHAAFAWMLNNADRTGSGRTLDPDGTMHPVQLFTVTGEPTREFDVDVAGNGDLTFAWVTPATPPNTKVFARRLTAATQTLSAVIPVSTPPSPQLSDEPRVAVDPAGNATLVWRHLPGGSASLVETAQIDAAGTLGSMQTLTAPGNNSQGHAVAVDDAGRARITWVEKTIPGTNPFLPMTCFNSPGHSCGADLTLSNSEALLTTVAVGTGGDALVGFGGSSPGQVVVIPHPGSGLPPVPSHTLSPNATSALLGVDAGGDGVAAWDEGGTAKAAGYDNVAPVIQNLSIPARAERGLPTTLSAAVVDVWGITHRWSFGDGGQATGPPTVQHTFNQNGTYPIQVTATDGAGATASATGQVTVTDTLAPTLGQVTMSRKRFRVARSATPLTARKRRPARGSAFRFSLNEDATATIAISRAQPGKRVRGRCRRAHGPVSRRQRCTRFISAGRKLTRKLDAGAKSVGFSGRIGRRALRPGRYRATVTAVDPSGNRSRTRSVQFTVAR